MQAYDNSPTYQAYAQKLVLLCLQNMIKYMNFENSISGCEVRSATHRTTTN